MTVSYIHSSEMKPGQWVEFDHPQEKIKDEVKGPYRVINVDCFWDKRYWLMDKAGEIHDFCAYPFNRFMGCVVTPRTLPSDFTVKLLNNEDVKKIFTGIELEKLVEKSIEHLKRLAVTHTTFGITHTSFGSGFDPDNEGKTLTAIEILKKYNLQKVPQKFYN